MFDDVIERSRRLLDAFRAGEMTFANAQVASVARGGPRWKLTGEEPIAQWEQRDRQNWFRLTTTQMPGFVVLLRLEATAAGVAMTGLLVERDGREITARDMRRLSLRPLVTTALAGFSEFLATDGPPPQSGRPGRPGYDLDHWRRVHVLYLQAKSADPRRYVKRMRDAYVPRDRPSDATVRRWVKVVEQKVRNGEL